MSSVPPHHHHPLPRPGPLPRHRRRQGNLRAQLLLQRHHRLQVLRDGRHHHHQQDLLGQDLRQGQPEQLRGGRGERHPVQHQHDVQRHRVRREAGGAGRVHQPGELGIELKQVQMCTIDAIECYNAIIA